MTPIAVVMMILVLTIVVGGFAASIVRLQMISKKQSEEDA